jgi:hypothetical protein
MKITLEVDGTYTISGVTKETMIDLSYALGDEAVLLSEYENLEEITDQTHAAYMEMEER